MFVSFHYLLSYIYVFVHLGFVYTIRSILRSFDSCCKPDLSPAVPQRGPTHQFHITLHDLGNATVPAEGTA